MPASPAGHDPESPSVQSRCLRLDHPCTRCRGSFPAYPDRRCATFETFAGWGPARWLQPRCHRQGPDAKKAAAARERSAQRAARARAATRRRKGIAEPIE